MVVPGGGGFGNPLERDPERVLGDVRAGLLSEDAARSDYGVVLSQDGHMDIEATDVARKAIQRKHDVLKSDSLG